MPESLALPVDVVEIAKLVAEEYAAHEHHARQRFAAELAETFLAMRPAGADLDAVRHAYEAAARVTLRLAGLQEVDTSGHLRTGPDGSESFRAVPNASEQHRTEANR